MLNDIIFQKGQGGLGRALTGEDHISALLFFSASLPSGFSAAQRIKKILSVADADSAGIKANYVDETPATATYTVSGAGAVNNQLAIYVNEPAGPVLLANYVRANASNTVPLVAAAIAAAINAGTITHGYTATVNNAVVTITARRGLGIYLNTGAPLTVTATGAIAGDVVQFTGGIASKFAVWRYHIAEYFRLQPKGVLYVGIFPIPGAYTFAEVATMQNFAVGKIRRIGVYKDAAAFTAADLTTLSDVCKGLDGLHMPLSSFYAADISGIADLTTLADLSQLTANKASAVISQDGGNLGAYLFRITGKSITNLGALLGASSLAKVSESIAWVAKFNISNGKECDTIAFANGMLVSDATVSNGLLNLLNDYRYIFLRKFVGVDGSYFNDTHTAIAASSDYAFIEDNLTIDKAIRGIYADLIPSLNSKIKLNSDGTISDIANAALTSQAGKSLDNMVRDEDLSAFEINIDPQQNVLSTKKLIVSATLLQEAVARNIEVPIAYTTSL